MQQQLQAAHCSLRVVHGDGDCLFAATLLCCAALDIDLVAELGLQSAHASHLRTFLAGWIRTHRQRLFDVSGGDDSWRGEAAVPQRRSRNRGSGSRMTLDDCLDLLADTEQRAYDIPWSSPEPGAAVTNLGDYLPQMLATALRIRILHITTHGPPQLVGERDAFGQPLVGEERQITLVQGVRQNHWNAALPLPLPAADEKDARASSPVTPATDASSEAAAADSHQRGNSVRRRLFADAPTAADMQAMAEQLAHAQAALKESQEQQAQAQAQQEGLTRAFESIRRIGELVHDLQHTHQDHKARVLDPDTVDTTHAALQEILTLQSVLPPSDDRPLTVTQQMLDQWTTEIEELETALAAPFHPTSPTPLSATEAQLVCSRLNEMLTQLENAGEEFSFMQLLLLAKKVLCVDQLSPSKDAHLQYPSLELLALLMRLTAHDRLWSLTLRLPWRYFEDAPIKMTREAAKLYVVAARAAAPDVLQQARLLVQQCKVLESCGRLHKAKKLDSVVLEYPEQPLQVLSALHAHYPAAGAPLDQASMRQLDEEVSSWRTAVQTARQQADELEESATSTAEVERAQQARAAVTKLAASPPRSFAQRMNQSRVFFHTDKRRQDHSASAEEKNEQFGQAKDAWDCLSACRENFQQLTDYRQKKKDAAAAVKRR